METFTQALQAIKSKRPLTFIQALGSIEKEAPEAVSVQLAFEPIAKADEEKQQVFGWFSVTDVDGDPVVDHHGAVIDEAELERAAYDYVVRSRLGADEHHILGTGFLIESMMFTQEKQHALGIDLGRSGWWGGMQITDKDQWAKIKNGERLMFSWGGFAQQEAIEDDGED